MVGSIKPGVKVFKTLGDLSRAAASSLVVLAQRAIERRGSFRLVLSGGGTPRALYQFLATEFRDRVQWRNVILYWGDERFVPPDDPSNNFGMAQEALVEKIPIPRENIYPMSTGYSDIEEAARAYEVALRSRFSGEWPEFDLVLLGLGNEGHTASLFPGSQALREQRRWVVPVLDAPSLEPRLTLTFPALNHARNVYFLVAGENKTHALTMALSDKSDPSECPASGVHPINGELIWWVDASAARFLKMK